MSNIGILRPMFHYSILSIIIVFILMCIIAFIYFYKFRKVKGNDTPTIIQSTTIKIITKKDIYLKKIDELENEIKGEKITTRKAYQKLSNIIRHFVYETTQIKVQNYSLEEIKKLNIQELTELVEEYYYPEFALESNNEVLLSINKAREVIKKWK